MIENNRYVIFPNVLHYRCNTSWVPIFIKIPFSGSTGPLNSPAGRLTVILVLSVSVLHGCHSPESPENPENVLKILKILKCPENPEKMSWKSWIFCGGRKIQDTHLRLYSNKLNRKLLYSFECFVYLIMLSLILLYRFLNISFKDFFCIDLFRTLQMFL